MYSYENNQQITILSIDLHRGETRDHQSQLQTWVFYPRKCIDRLVWRWFILPACCTIPEVQVLKASQWITSCKWLRSAQLLNLAVDCKHVHNKATTSRERVRGRMRERARGRENKRERAREGERGGRTKGNLTTDRAPFCSKSHTKPLGGAMHKTSEHRCTYTYTSNSLTQQSAERLVSPAVSSGGLESLWGFCVSVFF